MYEITLTGKIKAVGEEAERIAKNAAGQGKNPELHYLAFDRQLMGFSPLGAFLMNCDPKILENEKAIINELMDRQEVCSLYPLEQVSLYPMKKDRCGYEYDIDLANIDRHFRDILYLNDAIYKTSILYVDYGHGARNWNEQLIVEKLQWLLRNSKVLKKIYMIEH